VGDAHERLQKVLAAAGIGSRRQCEDLILEGRVEVDRQVVDRLGSRVDPQHQEVRVDGTPLRRPRLAYYVVNKPVGVVCTNRDPDGRTRVIDLIQSDERLYAVGRLDRTSEGLILVTNDGELANLLTHPRYGVHKVYRVYVAGYPAPELLSKLREGIHLAEGIARVSSVRTRRRTRDGCELEIALNEGRNREIRRLLARVGHKVLRLRRVAMGPLTLGDLPSGAYRRLAPQEVRRLKAACFQASREPSCEGGREGDKAQGARRAETIRRRGSARPGLPGRGGGSRRRKGSPASASEARRPPGRRRQPRAVSRKRR
jgi:23S rRNA pseudouridine2605 synthase